MALTKTHFRMISGQPFNVKDYGASGYVWLGGGAISSIHSFASMQFSYETDS
jgi:hypothetical protein